MNQRISKDHKLKSWNIASFNIRGLNDQIKHEQLSSAIPLESLLPTGNKDEEWLRQIRSKLPINLFYDEGPYHIEKYIILVSI